MKTDRGCERTTVVTWISRTKGEKTADLSDRGKQRGEKEGRAGTGLMKRAKAYRDRRVDRCRRDAVVLMATSVASRRSILTASEKNAEDTLYYGAVSKSKTTRYIHQPAAER